MISDPSLRGRCAWTSVYREQPLNAGLSHRCDREPELGWGLPGGGPCDRLWDQIHCMGISPQEKARTLRSCGGPSPPLPCSPDFPLGQL